MSREPSAAIRHLFDHHRSYKKRQKKFRRDSAYDYYGSVIQTLKRKFKKNELLSNPTFVTEVRSDILKLIARRNILEGGSNFGKIKRRGKKCYDANR